MIRLSIPRGLALLALLEGRPRVQSRWARSQTRHSCALDVTNPGTEPTDWILRILDERHDWSHEDRLNLPVTIPPRTRTTLRIAIAAIEGAPQGRRMDLGTISNVMLFATRPAAADGEFYVSRVWLE